MNSRKVLRSFVCIVMSLAGLAPSTVSQQMQTAAPSPQPSLGQRAVDIVLRHYVIDPSALITKTGKPLPADGAWSVGKNTPTSCPKTTDPCVQVIYRVPDAEVSCEWVVLLGGAESPEAIIDENEDAVRYLIARFSGSEWKTLVISQQRPIYPPTARAAHVQGSVKLTVHISSAGEVDKVTVISGPEMLRAAAVDSVQKWLYKPLMVGPSAIPFQMVVTVNFRFAQAG